MSEPKTERLEWIEPLKALALLAILLNHFVECFGDGPWFTNPSRDWPDLSTRLRTIYPTEFPFPISLVQFLGWLGDSAPGVFILLSGFGLSLGVDRTIRRRQFISDFYRRRLTRVFPLYWAMHVVIFALAVAVPNSQLIFRGPKVLLSFLGLRFTDSLFYFISPSWWFVWLILQLYAVFPFLYLGMCRFGDRRFLALSLLLTVFSRVLGYWYPGNLTNWMTGLFFGTRLAEFSAGMVLARKWSATAPAGSLGISQRRMLVCSCLIYALGLMCSWTYLGSLVSNFLVTLGMSGLFYWAYDRGLRQVPWIRSTLTWIGVHSYAVFLLHQPPLQWVSRSPYRLSLRIAGALLVLFACFPASRLIETVVRETQSAIATWSRSRSFTAARLLGNVLVLVSLLVGDPFALAKLKVYYLVLATATILLVIFETLHLKREAIYHTLVCRTALVCVFFKVFILTSFGPSFLWISAIGLLIAISVTAFEGVHYSTRSSWVGAFCMWAILGAASEFLLRRYAPIETAVWGELPALQTHPTCVYGLRPDQTTRLKYNNYDYVVRTNSLGLASPEIPLERPSNGTLRVFLTGDAFTMPEGLSYERAYPFLLQTALREKLKPRAVQVINGGVTGYGPVEELAQSKELIPRLKPDLIIYEFFINEFEEVSIEPSTRLASIGLDPRSRKHLDDIQILHRLRSVQNAVVERLTGRPARWRRDKALLAYYETGDTPLYSKSRLELLRSYLDKMRRVAIANGATFVLCFVPGAIAVSNPKDIDYFPWDVDLTDVKQYDLGRPLRNLRKITDGLGIHVLDLTPYLRSHPVQPVYFPGSWHWNEEGHRVVAQAISAWVETQGYCKGQKP